MAILYEMRQMVEQLNREYGTNIQLEVKREYENYGATNYETTSYIASDDDMLIEASADIVQAYGYSVVSGNSYVDLYVQSYPWNRGTQICIVDKNPDGFTNKDMAQAEEQAHRMLKYELEREIEDRV